MGKADSFPFLWKSAVTLILKISLLRGICSSSEIAGFKEVLPGCVSEGEAKAGPCPGGEAEFLRLILEKGQAGDLLNLQVN